MNISAVIEQKVTVALQPKFFQLVNESHMHAGPARESHYKLVTVADAFTGMPKVRRHQLVYRMLSEELAGQVHALALHLYSPEEWGEQPVPPSPPCANEP